MDAKIDYISFTIMVDVRGAGDEHQAWVLAVNALWERHPVFATWCQTADTWQSGGARKHYGFSQWAQHIYASIRFGGQANHILVELPGTACQDLRDQGVLEQVVSEAAGRLTRLDLAVDIPAGCSPGEFVAAGYSGRFQAKASLSSESGSTEYVGSMKSERFARVYMYAPPHPRAGVLRVEHVLRAGYAKSAADIISQSGLLVLASVVGNSFGWSHTLWKPDALTDGKLRASRADRHEPGRVRWLWGVVLPALVKADQDGLLDLADFMARAQLAKAALGRSGKRQIEALIV
jgi:hypothetical protein